MTISQDIVIDTLQELQDEKAALLSILCMATFGGLVAWLRLKGEHTLSRLFVLLCTAAFAGLVVYYLTSAVGLNEEYQCALSGIAGYGGGTILDECVDKVREIIHSKQRKP